ncbi:MAG: c-type cytochrome [Nitrospinota bacterium]
MVVVPLGSAWTFAAFAHEGHKVEHNHPYPTKKFSVKNGEVLYKKYCASCHGKNGDGKGPAGPSLKPRPTSFLDLKYMTMRSRVDHYEAIASGRPNTAMSPWKNTLTDREIWDVIAYIEHLYNHSWDADSNRRNKTPIDATPEEGG